MNFIKYLQELLEGRGFFASFLVISGWSYVIILIGVLIWQIFLYFIGQKYDKKEFNNNPSKDCERKE